MRLFRRVAEERLGDAKVLLSAGRETGAVYLAGYAVECALKSLLLAAVPPGDEQGVMESFRGNAAHDFGSLLHRYRQAGGADLPLDRRRDLVRVNVWAVEWRYQPGQTDGRTATAFLDAAERLLRWANERL